MNVRRTVAHWAGDATTADIRVILGREFAALSLRAASRPSFLDPSLDPASVFDREAVQEVVVVRRGRAKIETHTAQACARTRAARKAAAEGGSSTREESASR